MRGKSGSRSGSQWQLAAMFLAATELERSRWVIIDLTLRRRVRLVARRNPGAGARDDPIDVRRRAAGSNSFATPPRRRRPNRRMSLRPEYGPRERLPLAAGKQRKRQLHQSSDMATDCSGANAHQLVLACRHLTTD